MLLELHPKQAGTTRYLPPTSAAVFSHVNPWGPENMLTANKQKGENTNICEVERLSLVSHEEKQINTNWTLKWSWTYGLSCGPDWLQPPNKQLKVCFPPASAGACCCISSQQANLSPTSSVWCKLNFFTNNFYSVLCPRVSFCYLPYLTLRLAIMISCHMNVVINLISQPRGQCSYECGHMKRVESDQSHTMKGLQGAKRMILHRKIK